MLLTVFYLMFGKSYSFFNLLSFVIVEIDAFRKASEIIIWGNLNSLPKNYALNIHFNVLLLLSLR